MRRAVSPKYRFTALVTALITGFSLQPASAAQFITTISSSSCSQAAMNPSYMIMQPVEIPAAAVITSAQWKMWNTEIPSNASIKFYSSSGTAPGSTLLGTLSYSSWNSPIGTFTGNVSLSAAGRYWIRFSSTSRIDPCWSFVVTTTGTPAGWSVQAVNTFVSANNGVTFSSRDDNLSFLFTLFGTGGVVALAATTLSMSGTSSINFRQSITTSVTLGVAGSDGRVTFYANGKKIPGCINRPTSALSASCTWKPSRRGAVSVTALLTPTDAGYASSISAPKIILVGTRTSTR